MSSTSRRQDPPAKAGGLTKGTRKMHAVKTRFIALFTVVLLTTVLGISTFAVSASSNTETAAKMNPTVQATFLGTAINEFLGYFGLGSKTEAAPADDLTAQAGTCSAQSANTNLAAWWRAQGSLLDTKGTNTLTANGAATATGAPKVGSNSFNIPGGGSSFSVSNPPLNPAAGQGLTVDAWVNPSATGQSWRVVDKSVASDSTGGGYALDIFGGTARFYIVDTGNTFRIAMGVTQIPANTWTHIAGTFSVANGVRVFVNGNLEGAAAAPADVKTNTQSLRLGIDSAGTSNFNGLIDEVEVFFGPGGDIGQTAIQDIVSSDTNGKCIYVYSITPATNTVAEPVGNITTSVPLNFNRSNFPNANLNPAAIGEASTSSFSTAPGAAPSATGDPSGNCNSGNPAVNLDYSGASNLAVNFPANSTTVPFTITVCNDNNVEPTENFLVNVGSAGAYGSVGAGATVAITDADDQPVGVTAAPASPAGVAENGGVPITFTFTRPAPVAPGFQQTVTFTATGSATAGTDYTCMAGTAFAATCTSVTFDTNQTSATVLVNPTPDTTVEGDETVVFTVVAGTGYVPASPASAATASGTILNDDTDVSVAVLSGSPTLEGTAANGTPIIYRFTRNFGNAANNAALVTNFSTGGGTNPASCGTPAPADFTVALAAAQPAGSAATFTVATCTGTVTFGAGQTTVDIAVTPVADPTVEPDETVRVTATSCVTACSIVAPTSADGVITNDDTDVVITVAPASSLEDTGPDILFTFTRTGVLAGPMTINFSIAIGGNNATFGTDYVASCPGFTCVLNAPPLNSSITIPAGQATAVLNVNPSPDGVLEPDETVILATIAPSVANQYNFPSAPATGTITNDDTTVSVAVSPATAPETNTGNPAVDTMVYTFTRTGSNTLAQQISFSVTGSATFTADYLATFPVGSQPGTFTANSGTVTFAAGSSTAIVQVTPVGDTLLEGNETVILTVTAAAGYTPVAPLSATGTIIDDDTAISVAVAPATVPETPTGNAATDNLTYTFSRDANSQTAQQVVVSFQASGSATAGVDYNVTTGGAGAVTFNNGTGVGSVTIAAGAPSATVTVVPIPDAITEIGGETVTFTVTAPNPVLYTVGANAAATGTIVDDDANVSVAVSTSGGPGTTVLEDDPINLVYTFTRTAPTAANQTVTFSLTGSALCGAGATQDYTVLTPAGTTFDTTTCTGSVVIPAGQSTASITVDPTADFATENFADETVIATVLTSTGVNPVAPNGVTGTILNDDSTIQLSASAVTVGENVGNVVITVTRTGYQGRQGSVLISSTNGTATGGVACNGNLFDYQSIAPNTFATFVPSGPGTQNTTFQIPICDDGVFESSENFNVVLANPNGTGLTLGTPTTEVVTITDNDTQATYTLTGGSAQEGSPITFTITKTGSTQVDSLVCYQTTDGTGANGAVSTGANADFTAVGPPPVCQTFAAANAGPLTFTVNTTADNVVEGDETFTAAITSASNGGVIGGGPATGTILNNDTSFAVVTAAPASANEGDTNTLVPPRGSVASFTVTRQGDTTTTQQVDISSIPTIPGGGNGAGTATSGAPNTLCGNGAPGSNSVFGVDYITDGKTLVFAPGETTKTFTLLVCGDTTEELNETINVVLSNPLPVGGGAISPTVDAGSSNATYTIINDDNGPVLTISGPVSIVEGAAPGFLRFTVSSTGSTFETTFDFRTFDGTANSPSDYTGTTTSCPVNSLPVAGNPGFCRAKIAGGVPTAQNPNGPTGSFNIDIPVIADGVFEGSNETFTVQVSNPLTTLGAGQSVNGKLPTLFDGTNTVATLTQTGTIIDADAPNTFSITDVTQDEGNGGDGATTFNFTLSRSAPAQNNQTVCFTTRDGNYNLLTPFGPNPATGGPQASGQFDYTTVPSNCVVFTQGGLNSANIAIVVNGDTTFEHDEFFSVVLTTINGVASNPALGDPAPPATAASFAKGVGLGTIRNDDNRPVFSVTSPSVTEGTLANQTFPLIPTKNLVFNINEVGPTQVSSTVTFVIGGAGDSATFGAQCNAGVDYIFPVTQTGAVAGDTNTANGGTRVFAPQFNAPPATTGSTRSVTVGVCQDAAIEPNETLTLTLTAVNDGQFGTTTDVGFAGTNPGVGTITNDDSGLIFTLLPANDPAPVPEGNVGQTPNVARFTITRIGTSASPSTVCYMTVDGSATGAVVSPVPPGNPQDFTPITQASNTCQTFAPNINDPNNATLNNKTVDVTILPDNFDEINETFTLQLTSVDNGSIQPSDGARFVAPATILDDDAAAQFAIGPVVQVEGTSTSPGYAPFYFRITRTGLTQLDTIVSYATQASATNGIVAATAGANNASCLDAVTDYVTTSGSFTFQAQGFTPAVGPPAMGATFIDVPVNVCTDNRAEQNETFAVAITSAGNFGTVAASGSPADGTIVDDDNNTSFVIRNPGPEAAEGNVGPTIFNFTIDRTGTSSGSSYNVCYSTVFGAPFPVQNPPLASADAADIVALNNVCTVVAAGVTSFNVPVTVNGDLDAESNEAFHLRLISAANTTAGLPAAAIPAAGTDDRLAIIDNDDNAPARREGDINRDANRTPGSGTRGTVDILDLIEFDRMFAGTDVPTTGAGGEYQALDDDPRGTFGDGCLTQADKQVMANYANGIFPLVAAQGPTAPGCANARPSSTDKAGVVAVETVPNPNASAAARELRDGQVTAAQGTTVVLPVTLESQGDELAFQFSESFDTARLSYVSAALGPGAPAGTTFATPNTSIAGKVGFVLSSTTPFQFGTRVVVNITFNVLANAPLGNAAVTKGDSPTPRLMATGTGLVVPTYTDGFVNVVTPRSIQIVSTTAPAQPGSKALVGINLITPTGGERGASFTVNFDPTKFSISGNDPSANPPVANPDIVLGAAAVAAGCQVFTTNATQLNLGRLGLGLNCPNDFAAGTDRLFNLSFTNVAAAAQSVNDITFTGTPTNRGLNDANGSLPLPSFVNGTITILGPTAAGVSLSGRVTTPSGQGLRNATVVLTDSDGVRRSVITSSFGFYQFDDVAAGGTYVIGVNAKSFRFQSRIIQVTDTLADVNFTGVE